MVNDAGNSPGAGETPDISQSESSIVCTAVRAIRQGDDDEFHTLVKLYHRRVFTLALMVVRDPTGAEEVTQNAFVSAYTHLDLYDERRPFYPWLATIAFRKAHTWNKFHARVSYREGTELNESMENHASGDDPLGALISDERGRRLWNLVAQLPSGQRAVVLLYYQQEMKIEEIARALGVVGGTVKTLLFRARRNLRETIAGNIREFLPGR